MKILRRGFMFLVCGKNEQIDDAELIKRLDSYFQRAVSRLRPNEEIVEVLAAPDVGERVDAASVDGLLMRVDRSIPAGHMYFIVEDENDEEA